MARKKDMSFDGLKNHLIDWWCDRIKNEKLLTEEILADNSIPLDEKELILGGIANSVEILLELLDPVVHDEDDLLEWAEEFIDEYKMPENDEDFKN